MTLPRLALSVLAAAPLFAQADPKAGERKLATIPDDIELSRTENGPDGRSYTDHTRFAFGEGGSFVAYGGFRGGKSVAFAGDTEIGTFDYLHQPVTDADAKHYAFRAGVRKSATEEEWWAIVDGEKGKGFAWVSSVAVDHDGVAAFWVEPDAKIQSDGFYEQTDCEFWVGKRKGKKFDGTTPVDPLFAADGKTAATVARRGGSYFVITATTKKESVAKRGYPMIEDVAISPDGKRTAATVVLGGPSVPPGMPAPPGTTPGKLRVVVDGDEYGDDTDGAGAVTFAPKGKAFAYKFVKDGKMGLALDGDKKPAADYDFVGEVAFAPDGKTIAFTTNAGGKVEEYTRLLGAGAAEGGYWSLHTRKGKDAPEVVVEGVEGARFPTFGPNGELAYAQRANGRWYVMVGDRRSEGCDEVGNLRWRADGKAIEFGARIGRELWWKVFELE